MEQGSESWHHWRSKGIGSSEIGTIMGLNPYKNVEQLWLEKTGQIIPEDISNKYVVKRGTALEPFARNIFNERSSKEFMPAVFTHKEYDFMRYSSDGYHESSSEIIEIKCMGDKNHQKCIDLDGPLDYYFHQMQWGMMISETTICHFIAYNPSFPDPMFIKEIKADKDEFENMKEVAIKFWHCVQNKINPMSSYISDDLKALSSEP